jgi:hypothetical protein
MMMAVSNTQTTTLKNAGRAAHRLLAIVLDLLCHAEDRHVAKSMVTQAGQRLDGLVNAAFPQLQSKRYGHLVLLTAVGI